MGIEWFDTTSVANPTMDAADDDIILRPGCPEGMGDNVTFLIVINIQARPFFAFESFP